jgi:outer membrane protein assembly factor BamD
MTALPTSNRATAIGRVLLIALLVAALPACTTWKKMFDDKEEETETLPVEELYRVADTSKDVHNWSRATKYYQRLVSRFPYGVYSEQSQLELAYVLYKDGKTEEATSAVERFIRTYPTHRHIDYAYYLKALINFDHNSASLLRLLRQDMANRDLGGPTQALNDFADVIRRYPNSRYAPDARQRMIYLRNLLARHEINVGIYYLRKEAFVAAANRGKYILETYPRSEYQGDALALMVKAYEGLGQQVLADDAKRVLVANFPNHPMLTQSYWPGESFLNRMNPFN